jgi:hypothetical protein
MGKGKTPGKIISITDGPETFGIISASNFEDLPVSTAGWILFSTRRTRLV